jgi:hypothetical protein
MDAYTAMPPAGCADHSWHDRDTTYSDSIEPMLYTGHYTARAIPQLAAAA